MFFLIDRDIQSAILHMGCDADGKAASRFTIIKLRPPEWHPRRRGRRRRPNREGPWLKRLIRSVEAPRCIRCPSSGSCRSRWKERSPSTRPQAFRYPFLAEKGPTESLNPAFRQRPHHPVHTPASYFQVFNAVEVHLILRDIIK